MSHHSRPAIAKRESSQMRLTPLLVRTAAGWARGLAAAICNRGLLAGAPIVVAAALLSISPSRAESGATCPSDTYHFDFGANTTTNVYVTRDTPCEKTIVIRGDYVISGFVIERRASHGIAGVSKARDGLTLHWAYRPAAGFVGEDEFVVKVTLVKHGDDARDSIVTYQVVVK
jgi:hypothetical protein